MVTSGLSGDSGVAVAALTQQAIDAEICEDTPIEKYCCNATNVITSTTATTTSTGKCSSSGKACRGQ